jgi:hypothetical protein
MTKNGISDEVRVYTINNQELRFDGILVCFVPTGPQMQKVDEPV